MGRLSDAQSSVVEALEITLVMSRAGDLLLGPARVLVIWFVAGSLMVRPTRVTFNNEYADERVRTEVTIAKFGIDLSWPVERHRKCVVEEVKMVVQIRGSRSNEFASLQGEI